MPTVRIDGPIVILGAARSGTRFLRDTVAASAEVAAIPYDVNFIWRTGNEACRHDALVGEQCTPAIAAAIRRQLDRAAGQQAGNAGRRLLEKTVSNTVRLEFVARVFPDADYVHLIRDGRQVVASALGQWRGRGTGPGQAAKLWMLFPRHYRYALWVAMNRLRGAATREGRLPIWGVRYEAIHDDLGRLSLAEVCARQWVESVASVRRGAARLPSLRIREIRYESLLDSASSLGALLDWLALAERGAIMARHHALVRPAGLAAWDAGLEAAEAAAVSRIIGPLQDELGYR